MAIRLEKNLPLERLIWQRGGSRTLTTKGQDCGSTVRNSSTGRFLAGRTISIYLLTTLESFCDLAEGEWNDLSYALLFRQPQRNFPESEHQRLSLELFSHCDAWNIKIAAGIIPYRGCELCSPLITKSPYPLKPDAKASAKEHDIIVFSHMSVATLRMLRLPFPLAITH
jgi:hypothetical protein